MYYYEERHWHSVDWSGYEQLWSGRISGIRTYIRAGYPVNRYVLIGGAALAFGGLVGLGAMAVGRQLLKK